MQPVQGGLALGWGPLVEHVEVVRVPGDHHTIVTRHTELIARAVQARRDVDAWASPIRRD